MAAKYLKSLVTGVVLPYNEAGLKCADLRLMDPPECAEYEASIGVSHVEATEAAPAPEPEPVFEEIVLTPPEPKAEEVEAEAEAEAEGEAEKLLAALEVD